MPFDSLTVVQLWFCDSLLCDHVQTPNNCCLLGTKRPWGCHICLTQPFKYIFKHCCFIYIYITTIIIIISWHTHTCMEDTPWLVHWSCMTMIIYILVYVCKHYTNLSLRLYLLLISISLSLTYYISYHCLLCFGGSTRFLFFFWLTTSFCLQLSTNGHFNKLLQTIHAA